VAPERRDVDESRQQARAIHDGEETTALSALVPHPPPATGRRSGATHLPVAPSFRWQLHGTKTLLSLSPRSALSFPTHCQLPLLCTADPAPSLRAPTHYLQFPGPVCTSQVRLPIFLSRLYHSVLWFSGFRDFGVFRLSRVV
jgi:hypothetical protein